MTLNNSKCNHLTPLRFKGLMRPRKDCTIWNNFWRGRSSTLHLLVHYFYNLHATTDASQLSRRVLKRLCIFGLYGAI